MFITKKPAHSTGSGGLSVRAFCLFGEKSRNDAFLSAICGWGALAAEQTVARAMSGGSHVGYHPDALFTI